MRALKTRLICGMLLAAVCLAPVLSFGQLAASADIPYRKVVLDNGLTVIVHEDHKTPIVAFNIWYHVGSKNEKPGKTGFAHVFEHLMFNGSENHDEDYFPLMEKTGATDLNGTTSEDRTNYFENVPASAIDVVLWAESDRMGHLLGAVTQAKLDEQRGVVQNEKRQYENQPYALADELIAQACFPKGHPYSWTVIGSMDDLTAASLGDVHEWFKAYYGPSNAVVVIAGDIGTEEAIAKVKTYFGDIPPGPPITRPGTHIAKRTGVQRQVAQDRVPQTQIYKIWNIPQWGDKDSLFLDLAASILADGKSSQLYKRLVYTDQIATRVSAYAETREIAGLFHIEAMVKPGVEPAAVEKALDEELARFLKDGPTADELARVKAQTIGGVIRGMERIGGFGGKSDILASSQVFGGTPDAFKNNLAVYDRAGVADIQQAARTWLSDGVYVLEVQPYPEGAPTASSIDRSKIPVAGTPPDARFPKLERATLSNGLNVILARRDAIPVVDFNLLLDAGTASDQFNRPGTASLALNMLDEGTARRTSLQISDDLAKLGATLVTGSSLDHSSVELSALKVNLDPSLEIFADVVLSPSFPEKEFLRLQKQMLAGIQQEKAQPMGIAIRVLPRLLYGEGHAYGNPLSGSGTEASVSAITLSDLVKFRETWFKPNHATLIVVGAVGMDEIRPKLEKLFAGWIPGDVPQKNIGPVAPKSAPEIYLIDKPGSPSSIVIAGELTLPKANPEEIAIETMNDILGGNFTSRINMNLREDKHWSSGAGTVILDSKGLRPLIGYSAVQSDKTMESIREMAKEFGEIIASRPPTSEELDRAKYGKVLGLAGQWETGAAISGLIQNMVAFGLADDYYETYGIKVKELLLEQVAHAAKSVVRPEGMVWLVVGDRAKVEPALKTLGYGEVKLLDGDGNAVK
ncbi:MAG: pitrilysin family protein [Candidatus Aminicenantes bacterium]|nr:pitrilysin family protein [Candidatus Aminicenantes bacterium]